MTLQLEDGKTYIDGTGEKVKVVLDDPTSDYPFRSVDEPKQFTYARDGKYIEKDGPCSIFNLLEEVVDEVTE